MNSDSERTTTHPGGGGRSGGRRRRAPLVVSVVAVVLAVSGAGTYIAASGPNAGSAGTEQRARGGADGTDGTDGTGRTQTESTAPPPALSVPPAPGSGVAPGEPAPSGGTVYQVRGELPKGPDRSAPYRAEGSVTDERVARLAHLLGMADTAPRSSGDEWVIGAGKDGAEPTLRVQKAAPGSWWYSSFGAATGPDDCRKGASCGGSADGPSGTAATGGGDGAVAPGERVAKEAALRVLKGFGLERSALSARQVVGSTRIVTADPVVGGLPTHGWSTVLGIGPDGTVLSGSGMLAAPVKGAEEKVVGAATALARLNAASLVIAPSGCATDLPRENGRPAQTAPKAKTVPCGVCATDLPLTGQGEKPGEPEVVCARERPPAAPRTVTVDSVEFGLSLQYPRGTAALVPSWLFRVEPTAAGAAPYTVAQPASESWPGQPAAAPVPAPPVERPVEPPAAREPEQPATAAHPSYRASGRTLTVGFWGGVCGEPEVTARESGDRVLVRIEEPEPAPGTACVALAKDHRVPVTLRQPLGDRKVVDAATGKALARS